MRLISALLIAAAGAVLFVWPFFGREGLSYASGLALVAGAILVLAAIEIAARRLDTRTLALLAAVAALDSALRVAFPIGFAGFSPFFLLILCFGYALGPSLGFTGAALAMLASDVAIGALGPYVPYQLLAAGWTGALAGLAGIALRRPAAAARRRDLVALAAVGAATGLLFGALTDIQDWTTFYRGVATFGWQPGLDPGEALRRFGEFYLATSLVYDLFRSVGNAVLVLALGAPILAALLRFRGRLEFQADSKVPIG